MNNRNSMKAAGLGLLAAGLMSVIGSLGGVLPFSGILIYVISILFFICDKKNGFIFTLPFLTAAYMFVSLSTTFSGAIGDILAPGLMAIVMGELTRINRNQNEVLVKGILTGSLCMIASFIAVKYVENVSMLTELRMSFSSTVNTMLENNQLTIYEAARAQETYESLLKIVPSFLIVIIILGSLFIYFSGCDIMRKRGEELPKFMPFREFSFPKSVLAGSAAIMAAGFLAGKIGIVNGNVILVNITIIICFMFALQGFALAMFFINISRYPKIVCIILTCLLFASMIGTVFLFFMGVFDILIDIRGRAKANRG